MKLTTPANKCGSDASSPGEWRRRHRHQVAARRRNHGFTLAEVMAALMFLAIVIPTAVEALHIASLAGEVAVRKSAAARVADRILNESLVTTNWNGAMQSGTITEGTLDLKWKLTSESWSPGLVQSAQPAQSMQLLSAEVTFSAQGKDYSVKLSTLANAQPLPPTTINTQF